MRASWAVSIALMALASTAWCKVYERCELARELLTKHRIPRQQLATWVCIAKYESLFNTSIVGHINHDGSGDHGLFQISDVYWCSPPGRGWACGVSCDKFEDDDIADDLACARRIFREHQRLSGDGFNAWAVYRQWCDNGRANTILDGCFTSEQPSDNAIKPDRDNAIKTTPLLQTFLRI